jgi:hypothetical protein
MAVRIAHGARSTSDATEQDALAHAMADCGQGIASHLRCRPEFAELSDERALAIAVEPHVTGAIADAYGVVNNAGLGLARSKNIAQRANGRFYARTGGAELLAERQDVPPHVNVTESPWNGTLVTVSLTPRLLRSFEGISEAVNEDLHRSDRGIPRFERGPAPQDAIIIRPDIGKMAQNKDDAIIIARDRITPALQCSSGDVHIDMSGIRMTTQSFIHSLLYPSISRMGVAAARRLVVYDASMQVRSIVVLVTRYSLDAFEEQQFAVR